MYAGKLVFAQITEHLPLPFFGNAWSVMVAITKSIVHMPRSVSLHDVRPS